MAPVIPSRGRREQSGEPPHRIEGGMSRHRAGGSGPGRRVARRASTNVFREEGTPLPKGKRFRTMAVSAVATMALGVGFLSGLGPAPGNASSHREAPLVAADPQIDATDLYAFVSPDKPSTVTIISNWIPFEEPAGGSNFFSFSPDAYYDINIANNGDAKPDITYRWGVTNH